MFSRGIKLFELLGFTVRVDASWLLLAFLVVFSLATGLFPQFFADLPVATYWWMGVGGALGLFASIVLHELSHSIVARRYGIPMKGITLFIFGGVAEMEDEPPSAKSEFLMAIAGPIASFLVALASYLVYVAGNGLGASVAFNGVFAYLAWINLILAVFNMVPAFPLDGGRVLRSALWYFGRSLRRATRIASAIGSGFGVVLIVLGGLSLLGGNFIGGLWWIMLGLFVRSASQMSYRQMLFRRALEGEQVRRFMKPDPVTVPRHLSVEELVNDYIYEYHYKTFPVADGDKLIGCVTTQNVKQLPREEWSRQTVGSICGDCTEENSIGPDTDAMKALALMNRTGNSRLMVVDHGNLLGIVSLKDLLGFLALKLDLEEDEAIGQQLPSERI